MSKRGVRAWEDEPTDLFTDVPPMPAPPPPPPKAATKPARQPYSERENRQLERVFDLINDWVFSAELEALKAADPVKLAKRWPPIHPDDLAEMIAHQITHYDRKDETLKKWQRIR